MAVVRVPLKLCLPTAALIERSHPSSPTKLLFSSFSQCSFHFPPTQAQPTTTIHDSRTHSAFLTFVSFPGSSGRSPERQSKEQKQRDHREQAALRFIQNHASSCRRLSVGAGGHDRGPDQCAGGLVPVRGGRAAFSGHCEWYVVVRREGGDIEKEGM